MTLQIAQLDVLSDTDAATALGACCGASAWVAGMLAQRPFGTREALMRAADDVWSRLAPSDWLEAFAHHPRLGESRAAASVAAVARGWSAAEQSGTRAAPEHVAAALADGNHAYEARFGFIFILCASGLNADQMLDNLERRLANDASTELCIAAEEQRKITRLRLETLVPATADERRP